MTGLLCVLGTLTAATGLQSSDGTKLLEKLAGAKFVQFSVECVSRHVSLPDDPVQRVHLKGTLLIAKDGRWRWSRPDGWDVLFDGVQTYLTVIDSPWYEPVPAVDLQGEPLSTDSLKGLLLGLDPFFNGKWRHVPGQVDWMTVPVSDSIEPNRMFVAQPKSPSLIRETRESVITAAIFLQFDTIALVPVFAEIWDSQSQDRTERQTIYRDFVFDPPQAGKKLSTGAARL